MCPAYWRLYLGLVAASRQLTPADGDMLTVTVMAYDDHDRAEYRDAAEALRAHARRCARCQGKADAAEPEPRNRNYVRRDIE